MIEEVAFAEQVQDTDLVNMGDVAVVQREEDRRDAQQLAADTAVLSEMMADGTGLIVVQGELLVTAREHVEEAEVHVEEATQQLDRAKRSMFSRRVWQLTAAGLGIGMALGFPLGAGIAIATASTQVFAAGATGAVLGSVVGGSGAYAGAKSRT